MSKKPVALITADCHLADHAWADRPTLCGDAYYAFEQLCNCAIARGIPAIVVAGDLIDKRRNESTVVHFLRTQMEKLAAADVRLLFIQGDHDWQPVPWLQAASQHTHHLHLRPFEVSGFEFVGIDFQSTSAAFLEALDEAELKSSDILVIHQKLEDFLGGLGGCNGSLGMIPKVNLVVAGDYHVHDTIRIRGNDAQKITCLSPGSTCMQSIDETPGKQFFVLFDDESIEEPYLPTRPCIKQVPLLEEHELEGFLARLDASLTIARTSAFEAGWPDSLAKPILYVPFSTELDNAYRRIQKAVGDRAHFFHKMIRPDKPETIRSPVSMKGKGLIGCLPLAVPDTKSELYAAASRMLLSTDPQTELQVMRKEYLT